MCTPASHVYFVVVYRTGGRCTLTKRTTSPRRTRDPTQSPCWVSAETLRQEKSKSCKEEFVFLAVFWIQLFISMRIRIQGAKPMRILILILIRILVKL
jgi:hypothetical protein